MRNSPLITPSTSFLVSMQRASISKNGIPIDNTDLIPDKLMEEEKKVFQERVS